MAAEREVKQLVDRGYEHGFVTECTTDNVVAVTGGVLFTPKASSGALDGITLETTVEIARETGCEIRFTELSRYDLYTADECFLTGTACEIMPVTKIDGRIIGTGRPGPITGKLNRLFSERVRAADAPAG